MTVQHAARRQRGLWAAAVALALVVVAASSWLRLSANGLGCEPWPYCYGQAETAAAMAETPATTVVRAAHRVAASLFGAVALLLVLAAWRRYGAVQRAAAIALLLLTAVLAIAGRYTPSPWPAITLINALGGLVLLLLLAALWHGAPARRTAARATVHGPRTMAVVLAVALLLQAAAGVMISVRLAGAACVGGCTEAWVPGAMALFDATRPGSAFELTGHRHAGELMQWSHWLGGFVLLLAALALARSRRWRNAVARPALPAWAIGATVALGVVTVVADRPAAAGAAHAIAAGLALAACVIAFMKTAVAARPQCRQEGGSHGHDRRAGDATSAPLRNGDGRVVPARAG